MFHTVNAFSPAFVSNNFASTSVYHFDGSNFSTGPFPDAKGVSGSFVARGSTQLASTSPKFGTASIDFDSAEPGGALLEGTGDADPTITAFIPSLLNPFTIDFWVNIDAFPVGAGVRHGIYVVGIPTTLNFTVDLDLDANSSSMNLLYQDSPTPINISKPFSEISLGVWHHIAFINVGGGPGTLYFCFDGAVVGSFAHNTSQTFGRYDISSDIRIGYNSANRGDDVLNGRIDELHINVGTAQWTTFPFTPPEAPYL